MANEYAAFRRDRDAVLAGRDPAALRAFMIERGKWPEGTTTDHTPMHIPQNMNSAAWCRH